MDEDEEMDFLEWWETLDDIEREEYNAFMEEGDRDYDEQRMQQVHPPYKRDVRFLGLQDADGGRYEKGSS